MKKIVIVDFDGTLFPGNSMPFIWKCYGKYGFSRKRQLLAYGRIIRDQIFFRKILKDEEKWRYYATVHMFNLFEGMKDKEIREFFKAISGIVYKKLDRDVLVQIEKHRKDGYEIVLLSGGFQMLMEFIGKRIGASKVKGTPFAYNLDGEFERITTKELYVTMSGKKKKPYIESVYYNKNIDWANSYAYADNITDVQMMALVGNPIAVNPDESLQACCEEREWEVLYS